MPGAGGKENGAHASQKYAMLQMTFLTFKCQFTYASHKHILVQRRILERSLYMTHNGHSIHKAYGPELVTGLPRGWSESYPHGNLLSYSRTC